MDDWIKKQEVKYADPKKGFGEADVIVDMNLLAYQELKSHAMSGMKFLDLGTNSGRVAHEMKLMGLCELGVDLPAVIAKVKYPINKLSMDLEKEFPEGAWDLIFCRETIEHLRNYQEVCRKIFCGLTTTGRVVITAPCDDRDSGNACPEHVRVFKDKELDKLICESGGEIIKAFNERRQRVIISKRKT